ncbi:MAG: hypothetical protein E4G94_02780 [ANME-2 cluster archaeon]|nr:MAG: hypothetical protein E4G94_02780 [ANME-2 cluster archaeon]
MTGISLPWKMNPEQLTSFKSYCKKPTSAALIMGGTGLLMEHLFTFDGFDLMDWWGHEYVGMGLIITGFLLSIKWGQWKSLKLWIFKNQIR